MDALIYFLQVALLAGVLYLFWVYYRKSEKKIADLTQKLTESEQQLKIAEENYYTRKMGQEVFHKILHYYKAQMIELELKINQIQNPQKINIDEKLKQISAKIHPATHAKIHRTEKLLKEIELLMGEINYLQSKLMKHEIDEDLFNYLAEEKHKRIIKAESDIRSMAKEKEQPPKEGKKKETTITPEQAP